MSTQDKRPLGSVRTIIVGVDEALKVIEELRMESRKKYVPAYLFAVIYAGLKDYGTGICLA